MSNRVEPIKRSAEEASSGDDQGESKKAAVGEDVPVSDACPADVATKGPPTRKGIQLSLVVEDAEKVSKHLEKCIGASEYFRFPDDNGKMLHLALNVDNVAMFVEEIGNKVYAGPEKPHARLHMYMDDPLDKAEKLVKAGAKTLTKCEEQFWGSTFGVFEDPWGITWAVSTSSSPAQDVPTELEHKIVPFVAVKDGPGYLKFLSDVFGAEPVSDATKDSSGKILCAEMKINGGRMFITDMFCDDEGEAEASVTISYEVATGHAVAVTKAFEADGGQIVEAPVMQFWGQVWGRCKDAFGQTWGVSEPQHGPPPSNEDMAVDIRLAEKHKYKWSWTEEDVPKMYCFGEVRTVLAQSSEISAAVQEMLPSAIAEAGKKGFKMAGPPIAGYFTWESEEGGKTRLTAGPMVIIDLGSPHEEPAESNVGLAVRALGGVKCVTTTHVGPYEDLMKCYGATFEWVEAKGYENRMPVVEMYENDPGDTEPSKLRTKICIPIVPKGTPRPTGKAE